MSSRKDKETVNVVDQLSGGIGAVSLESTDGSWAVSVRKSKKKGGSNNGSSQPWPQQNTAPKAWGRSVSRNVVPQTSSKALPTNPVAPRKPAIAAPLERGWNWKAREGAGTRSVQGGLESNDIPIEDNDTDNDDDSYAAESDDELLSSDLDSDASDQSFESRKKNKWFKVFFSDLEELTLEAINSPDRRWHCPACQNGPGAVNWYRGLQPLLTHAKTKGSKRVMLHRELAKLLDEELRTRGTSVIPAGESFGKWKGLEDVKDREIIWPPMVVIMNTELERDEKNKWIGMGNPELFEYFSGYAAVKARPSYGPQGHRGMSMLIFENSAIGYLEAERLHEHFQEQRTDREAWNHCRVLFCAGGKRQLYGYMAEKEDLVFFNQHHSGKSRLKYEMKSYQEMVVSQLKQMSEDNQQLVWFKDRVAKEKERTKAAEMSFGVISEELRRTKEEDRIVRLRGKIHSEQNQQEMDYQQEYFKNQVQNFLAAREAKEDSFERLQQEEREKVKQLKARREDEIANFIRSQEKDMEEFVGERDKLTKIHEEERAARMKRYFEEEVEQEKKFDAQLNQLMANYTPRHSQEEDTV